MKVFKTMVGAGSKVMSADTIEYDGKLWIVPRWLSDPTGRRKPALLIRIDHLPMQRPAWKPFGNDFVLPDPMPAEVLEGHVTAENQERYFVMEGPEVWYPPDPRHLN